MSTEQEKILSDLLRKKEQDNKMVTGQVAGYRWERDVLIEDMQELVEKNRSDLQQQEQLLIARYEKQIDLLKQQNLELALGIPANLEQITPAGMTSTTKEVAEEVPFEKDIYTLEDLAIMEKQNSKGKKESFPQWTDIKAMKKPDAKKKTLL